MPKPNHSPLPWHIADDSDAIVNIDHQVICDFREDAYRVTLRPWNAAFIVRACNNHYKLVEALEKAIKILEAEFEAIEKLAATTRFFDIKKMVALHIIKLEELNKVLDQAKGEADAS